MTRFFPIPLCRRPFRCPRRQARFPGHVTPAVRVSGPGKRGPDRMSRQGAACPFRSTGGPIQRREDEHGPAHDHDDDRCREDWPEALWRHKLRLLQPGLHHHVPVVRQRHQRGGKGNRLLSQPALPDLHAGVAAGGRQKLRPLRHAAGVADRCGLFTASGWGWSFHALRSRYVPTYLSSEVLITFSRRA